DRSISWTPPKTQEGLMYSKNKSALSSAAAAIVVAAALTVVSTDSPSSRLNTIRPFAGKFTVRDVAGNWGEPGESDKGGEDPIGAEEENFLAHAYPASDIPLEATSNALKAWKQLKGKSKNTVGLWTLAGPSSASYPDVLTFSGASYVASGRVTGL